MAASFHDRYNNATPTYIRTDDKQFADLPAGSTILIPSPQDIEAEVSRAAEPITFTELRHSLAERHGAEGCCPVMTGMNLRVAAEVTFDALDAGVPAEDVVPIWNVIDPTSALAGKLPGGSKRVASLRQESC